MSPKFSNLERRVERLESILIELALRTKRCKYIYQSDLKESLLRKRVLKEKTLFIKNQNQKIIKNKREKINCELCNSFLHKTENCPVYGRFKTSRGWIKFKRTKYRKKFAKIRCEKK